VGYGLNFCITLACISYNAFCKYLHHNQLKLVDVPNYIFCCLLINSQHLLCDHEVVASLNHYLHCFLLFLLQRGCCVFYRCYVVTCCIVNICSLCSVSWNSNNFTMISSLCASAAQTTSSPLSWNLFATSSTSSSVQGDDWRLLMVFHLLARFLLLHCISLHL
jgi:hypothetical protein